MQISIADLTRILSILGEQLKRQEQFPDAPEIAEWLATEGFGHVASLVHVVTNPGGTPADKWLLVNLEAPQGQKLIFCRDDAYLLQMIASIQGMAPDSIENLDRDELIEADPSLYLFRLMPAPAENPGYPNVG